MSPRRLPLLALLFALAPLVAAADTSPAAAPAAASALPDRLATLDADMAGVLRQFDVPGMAVAIVKDGQVVLERGYGVRELGKPEPVDAHTLFAIASNTKAFTAASLAILADEGKLSMDDRVIERLPEFRMADPVVTYEMRIRDLLVHRSGLGLGAGDLLYWPATDYSTADVVERLAHVPIANSFRATYNYDNILFAVAQRVIERVSGMSYAEFLQKRIFDRVGLAETRFNFEHFRPGDTDIATGHAKFDFKDLRPVPPMSWSNNSGAGGLYSSVHDLAKWMNVQLAGGVLGTGADGKAERLFSQARHDEMWSLITPMPIRPAPVPELAAAVPQFAGYGEGWFVSDYRGQRMVWHTGGWPGMVSRVTMVPALRLGVVVLTNQESGAAFNAATYRVLDAFLGAPPTDWTAAFAAGVKKAESKADEGWAKHQAARDAKSKPSLPLARYAGTYRDPWYGDVTLTIEQGHLVMRFAHTAQLLGDLTPWQQDTFLVRWRDRSLNADAFATFALDPDGQVRELRMDAISSLTDFSFDFQDLRLVPVREQKD